MTVLHVQIVPKFLFFWLQNDKSKFSSDRLQRDASMIHMRLIARGTGQD